MDWKDATQKLQQNGDLIEQLSQSEDGKALMARLQQNGTSLEQASEKAQNGDYFAMIKLLKGVMADSEGRKLLERMAQQLQK